MNTALMNSTSNPHIADLEASFNKTTKPVDWLVIVHKDAQTSRLLSPALVGESAAVLEVSQDKWDFSDNDLLETIEWALQQGHLKNLVLVGRSPAVSPT